MAKLIKCGSCFREFSEMGLRTHLWRSHGNGRGFKPFAGKTPWNKGLTKELDSRVKQQSESTKLSCKTRDNSVYRTKEFKRRVSAFAKENGFGGYHPFPNKGAEYNGIKFHSSYEVIVAKSLDEHSVHWQRPTWGFVWNDLGRKYYPDFYLPEFDIYLDPKNDYLIQKDAEKIKQAQLRNNIKVIILDKNQLLWPEIKLLLS